MPATLRMTGATAKKTTTRTANASTMMISVSRQIRLRQRVALETGAGVDADDSDVLSVGVSLMADLLPPWRRRNRLRAARHHDAHAGTQADHIPAAPFPAPPANQTPAPARRESCLPGKPCSPPLRERRN